jgi:hypothetical protein
MIHFQPEGIPRRCLTSRVLEDLKTTVASIERHTLVWLQAVDLPLQMPAAAMLSNLELNTGISFGCGFCPAWHF